MTLLPEIYVEHQRMIAQRDTALSGLRDLLGAMLQERDRRTHRDYRLTRSTWDSVSGAGLLIFNHFRDHMRQRPA